MKEADWKTFRKMVPDLRERYLEKKNKKLQASLAEPKKTPTECFWNTFEQMEQETKILRCCLDGHSRSKMFFFMENMLRFGLMTPEDLENFSSELQEYLRHMVEKR